MRKKYDVTDDMLQKLHAGQEFKSFAELSRTMGVLDGNGKPLTSDSRKQFMEADVAKKLGAVREEE